ncbi:ATP-binding protein [Blastomonas sp.]|uniref:ATP-binding protein n=1 Tax=Blastomonas sp. TaxID=1909299 RepID=UPI00261FF715|nr:ATP-binding protein [Blastomonas sp.]MDM7958062.1 ATP-binding protein [Blastomonas sp.]
MIRRNFKPHSCDLDENGPESIHRAVALVHEFSASAVLTPQQTAKLAILVEEAVTNLYDHADVQPGFTGSLALSADDDGVGICLCDSGTAFDPRTVEDTHVPDLDRGGGAGLALIRAWADALDYRSEEGCNRLELKLRG